MNNTRIYVERKKGFDIEKEELQYEISELYNINLSNFRFLNTYDIFNLNPETLQQSITEIFSENNRDLVYTTCPISKMKLAIEYLPGQFDQRADSALQCIKLIDPKSDPTVTTGTMVLFDTIDDSFI